ncbi:MAG: helix-turn-helix transcriptional regulator [Synergistaceae bacterium]|nr:helix-turn-helix transcriptional regulator [Synergistaceae bacterium]
MIVFDRLWQTMKQRKISQYKLIKEYHISTGQIDRLRKNSFVSTYTINELCKILDCNVEDIIQYIKDTNSNSTQQESIEDK